MNSGCFSSITCFNLVSYWHIDCFKELIVEDSLPISSETHSQIFLMVDLDLVIVWAGSPRLDHDLFRLVFSHGNHFSSSVTIRFKMGEFRNSSAKNHRDHFTPKGSFASIHVFQTVFWLIFNSWVMEYVLATSQTRLFLWFYQQFRGLAYSSVSHLRYPCW